MAGIGRSSCGSGGFVPAVTLALALTLASGAGAAMGAAEADAKETLDYVYVDSTAGDAAAGHTAVRLGETVFHYQYGSDGLLLLVNDTWEDFRDLYNDRQNRSFTVTRVPVTRESYDRIRAHLFRRYVGQERRLLHQERLDGEHALLRRLASGEDAVAIDGLGFFSETRAGTAAAVELSELAARRLGHRWLSEQLSEVSIELTKTSFRAPAAEDWYVRLRERLAWREALLVLRDARALADDALVVDPGNGGALTDRERVIGTEFRRQLADSVLTLLESGRPDRGTALLVQIARYLAFARSLETGVFATLDPFSDAAELVPAAEVGDGERRLRTARAELAAFRESFVAEGLPREITYSRIEAAQGRSVELERALRLGTAVRIEEGHLLPRRSRTIPTGLTGTVEEYAVAARDAGRRRDLGREGVAQAYRYHLITRNCVTEIVRDVNEAFANRDEERRLLGGALVPGEGLSFIPCRWTDAVEAAYPEFESEHLPSYRLRHLDRQYEEHGPLVWMRESNTLTTTLSLSSTDEETVFLFFTDDAVIPRPVLGTLNLLYASAHAAGGLLFAPFDRGAHLTRGVRGMLYSLPEVVFFNIRKGVISDTPPIPPTSPIPTERRDSE